MRLDSDSSPTYLRSGIPIYSGNFFASSFVLSLTPFTTDLRNLSVSREVFDFSRPIGSQFSVHFLGQSSETSTPCRPIPSRSYPKPDATDLDTHINTHYVIDLGMSTTAYFRNPSSTTPPLLRVTLWLPILLQYYWHQVNSYLAEASQSAV